MFSTKNCWPRLSESFCATRRAMTSVGPPGGNPTTTRTGRFGYPCANDGAAPVSSNMAARIPCKTGIVALSWTYSCGVIIGDGTFENKGKARSRGRRGWKQSWCPSEPRSDWHPLTSTLLPRLDLVELGKRSFEFGIEEPHRIKNFAESCRCSGPVGLSKGEDAVVSQVSHDPRLGNAIADQVA